MRVNTSPAEHPIYRIEARLPWSIACTAASIKSPAEPRKHQVASRTLTVIS
jgi:hypothetical protein